VLGRPLPFLVFLFPVLIPYLLKKKKKQKRTMDTTCTQSFWKTTTESRACFNHIREWSPLQSASAEGNQGPRFKDSYASLWQTTNRCELYHCTKQSCACSNHFLRVVVFCRGGDRNFLQPRLEDISSNPH
jgi:hypothetical protein